MKKYIVGAIVGFLFAATAAYAATVTRRLRGTSVLDKLVVKTAGNFLYAGTSVTSTAAELNILDGVTSTAAELNILDGVTSTASELNILDGVTATATELNRADDATDSTETNTFVKMALFDYDVTGGDSGATGTFDTGIDMPDNAVILDGLCDVITTFTSSGDTATIALQVESADDMIAAIAINDGSNPWDAGLQSIIPVGTAATAVKTTSSQDISFVVAVEALTAGKVRCALRYYVSG